MNIKKFKLISLDKKQKTNFDYKKKVIIKDLLLNFVIGYYSAEKAKKQNVKFNIELNYTDQKNLNDKDIKSIVDYGRIIKVIKNMTKNKHYNFLESLADDLFDELFKDERIDKIKLKIEKLDAIREAASVGIEITKKRIHV
jgi:dihydroneopterin aldolase|tara:strand:- start:439 stop:861 length:423 start_codon:yes stop_codon:yes gene_type:complete